MGFMEELEVDEAKLKALYHRAYLESGGRFVDPRKYPYLDSALYVYAMDHNCSYDDALVIAKT